MRTIQEKTDRLKTFGTVLAKFPIIEKTEEAELKEIYVCDYTNIGRTVVPYTIITGEGDTWYIAMETYTYKFPHHKIRNILGMTFDEIAQYVYLYVEQHRIKHENRNHQGRTGTLGKTPGND